MDELIQSLIDSEIDDMILDLVYEIHSSIKGFSQEQFQINKTISIDKQTCICPNCGQTNLIATRFAYHLAKCLGAGRQSSRQAQRKINDQIMIITDSDENQFSKDIENNFISEDGSSCTDSISNSMTLINSNKNDEEDDWKPRKKKRRITTKNPKNKNPKNKNLIVVVSPSTSQIDYTNSIIPIRPVQKHVMIPLVSLPIREVTSTNNEKIFFKNHQISTESSHYFVESPLNLVEDDQSSIIIFKEDIHQN